MKWGLSMAQKIRTAAALIVVFLLVLATNLIDKHHFHIVEETLSTVYEDRLVAKNHLYKITRLLQYKRRFLIENESGYDSLVFKQVNDSINVLVEKFEGTRLIEEEELYLKSLKQHLNKLYIQERKLPHQIPITTELPELKVTETYYAQVFDDLDQLSEIQLTEGRKQIGYSTRAVQTSNLISKIEIGVLVLIGFLLQVLIFIKPLK